MIKTDKIIVRSGTSSQWSTVNPKLELGEIGYEIDTKKLKIGTGDLKWNGLSYIHSGAYYDSNNSIGSSGQVLASTGTGTDWVNLSEITGVDGSGTLNYLAKWTPDGNSIGNSQIFDNGTNIGLSTNSPAAPLHMYRASGNFIRLGITNANADTVEGRIDWYTNEAITADYFGGIRMRFVGGTGNANRQLQFLIGDVTTPKMTINGSGSISTTSPNHLSTYDCSNSDSSGVSERYFRYGGTNGDASSVLDVAYLGGTVASPIAPVTGRYVNSLSFRTGGTNASLFSNPSFSIRHTIGSVIGSSLAEVNTSFMTNSTGTGVPVATLELLGQTNSVRFPTYVEFGSAGATAILRGSASNVLEQRKGLNAQTFRIYNTYTDASNYEFGKIAWSSNILQIGTEKLGTGTARALALQTDGTTRLTINTSGNIGIGTSSPSSRLHVYAVGNCVQIIEGSNIAVLQFTGVEGTAGQINTYGDGSLRFGAGTNAASTHFVIASSGNIGLATASPEAKLDNRSSSIFANRGSSYGLNIIRESNAPGNTGERVFSITTNAVGGSTWNTYKRQRQYEHPKILEFREGETGGIFFRVNNVVNSTDYTSNMTLTDALVIRSDTGNVGIGTATPTVLLDIAGTTEVKNGLNPQSLRVYNTYTDASNYERAKIAWSSNVLQIGTEKLGTGSARALELQTNGIKRLSFHQTWPIIFVGNYSSSPPYIMPFSGSDYSTAADGRGFAVYVGSGVSAGDVGIAMTGDPMGTYFGENSHFVIGRNISPVTGTGIFNLSEIRSVVNQFGDANGITRGLYVNPTLTSAVDWRSIETSNNSGFALYTAGTAASYFGGNVGIKTASPGSELDVKGTLRLSGATSGYVGLAPAAAAGSTTYTLPAADGTNGQFLQTNGSGVLSWSTPTTGITSIATNNGITGGTITTNGTIGLTGQALALHNLATSGLIVRTAADTLAARTITGTANQITVTNGDGVAGNPTLALPQNIHTAATPTFGGATLNGTLDLRATSSASVATQIPVFVADPSSTTRTLVTRTPAQLRSDIGAQAALTNPVTGTGTTNYITKWTSSSAVGNSQVFDDGTNVGIGTASPTVKLDVVGDVKVSGAITTGGITSDYYRTSSNMIVTESGTTRTLSASDNGKIIEFTSNSAVTVTIGTAVGAKGFSVTIIQVGTGQISLSVSGVTLTNRQNHSKTAGQYAVVSLMCRATNTFVLAGDTAA